MLNACTAPPLATCSCGARYTLHDWLLLAFVVRLPGFAGDGQIELRTCRHCRSFLSVDLAVVHAAELDMSSVQRLTRDVLRDVQRTNDVAAERRCFVVLALLDRAQGFDHRRRDFLRELGEVRDYVRRQRSMAAWERFERVVAVRRIAAEARP